MEKQSFSCTKCKKLNNIVSFRNVKSIGYDLIVSESKCIFCGEPYFYEVFEDLDSFIFCNPDFFNPFDANRIVSTYTPILKDRNEIELFVLNNDCFSIGFNGYESVVLDKEILGRWYMTNLVPPSYDKIIYNIFIASINKPKILLSYPPSPFLNRLNFNYLFDRTESDFRINNYDSIGSYKEIYVGVK